MNPDLPFEAARKQTRVELRNHNLGVISIWFANGLSIISGKDSTIFGIRVLG